MSDQTEIELKKIVESAVRPVPAPRDRKKQMRAELLAHVHVVFEEEREHGNDQAALRQTRARFGDPAKLANELQAALSRSDRLAFFIERLVLRRSGEAAWRCALRRAAYLFAANEAMFLVLLPAFFLNSRGLQTGRTVYLVLCLSIAISTAMFAGSLLTVALRSTLFHRSSGRVVRLVGLCFLAMIVVPICQFGLLAAVSGELQEGVRIVRLALPFTVLLPVGLSLLAWGIEREERDHSEWADLKIETETQ